MVELADMAATVELAAPEVETVVDGVEDGELEAAAVTEMVAELVTESVEVGEVRLNLRSLTFCLAE
jgi:hypothetical protein